MNNFLYNYLIPKFGNNHKLVYTDTDSFVSQIYCKDFYKEIIPDIDDYFDTSNVRKDFKTLDGELFPSGKNKKVLGYFKDELGGKIMKRFIGLRSKMYSYETEEGYFKKCKGITRQAMKTITFDDYLDVFRENIEKYRDMNIIRSHDHTNYTETIYKKVLDGRDEKREIQEDGIETLPWR